jgi:3-hydroxy-9,10-secoandrosta-1,3,5(10)-triene-9,17-dione monooxygenase
VENLFVPDHLAVPFPPSRSPASSACDVSPRRQKTSDLKERVDVSEHDVLEAVRALAPALRERADETESLRRLPDATVEELAASGFFLLMQPRLYNGYAADPSVFYQTLHLLGRACGSTGWVAGVLGVNAWMLAQFDPLAQQDVWGADTPAG